MEEPENSIHPSRIPLILGLLQNIATDVTIPVGPENPLCQVIVSTHSASVIQEIFDDTLLIAEFAEDVPDSQEFNGVRFSWISDTWRAKALPEVAPVSKDQLLAYLGPTIPRTPLPKSKLKGTQRVIDRSDIQPLLFDFSDTE